MAPFFNEEQGSEMRSGCQTLAAYAWRSNNDYIHMDNPVVFLYDDGHFIVSAFGAMENSDPS